MYNSRFYNKVLHYYFKLRTWYPFWYSFLNRRARLLQEHSQDPLNATQQKIVTELDDSGIAATSLDTLFPGKKMLEKLQKHAQSFPPKEGEQGKKKFLINYWGLHPELDFDNPFLDIALSPDVLGIVNKYMNMYTKLKLVNLARTLPVGENSEAVQSQRWHRDPQEKKCVKMFIYLNDIDEEAGPFTYIPESHYHGKWGKLFPQNTPEGSYPEEKDVFEKIPQSAVRDMTGKAGTVIFCDTIGLHRGGYATKKDRLMFTAFYSAPSFTEAKRYSIPNRIISDLGKLPQVAQYALN